MPDRFVESHIRKIPIFQQLAAPQLDLVVRAFQVLRFEPGQVVVQQGNTTQGLFVMVDGEGVLLQANDNGERPVGKLSANDMLGQSALFNPGVEPATLRITSRSTLLFLSRTRMNTVLTYYPEVRDQLESELAPRPVRQAMRRADAPSQHAPHELSRDNEEIIMIRRRHPWSFIRRGWAAVLIFILFSAAGVAVLTVNGTLGFGVILTGLVLSALLMTYFYFEWRNDSIVVTDQRVVQIERVIPTFSVTINEIPIEQIQEVNTELPQGDIFARIFDYADIELKNASDTGNLLLDMVPQADEVQEAIFANRNKRDEMADETRRMAIRAEIERQLGLDKTRKMDAAGAGENGAAPAGGSDLVTRTFSPAPTRFTNASGETVIRKHVTVWLSHIIAPSLMILGAFVILGLSIAATQNWLNQFGAYLAAAMFVVGGLWFWWSDWDWRNDMYIIGDKNVTLIHKRPLWLQNEVEQVRLERVDNVLSEVNGFIDTVFQRGDVKMSLVGEGIDRAKVFQKVHRPQEIQAEISRRQARARNQEMQDEDNRQHEAIREYLSVYHEAVQDQNPLLDLNAQSANRSQPTGFSPNVRPSQRHDRNRPAHIPRLREDSGGEEYGYTPVPKQQQAQPQQGYTNRDTPTPPQEPPARHPESPPRQNPPPRRNAPPPPPDLPPR